jgi:hypothetical protein
MVVKLDNKINLISTNNYKRNLLILLILRKFEFKMSNLKFVVLKFFALENLSIAVYLTTSDNHRHHRFK